MDGRGKTGAVCQIALSLYIFRPVFACLGFLSPPNRGALMTAVLVSPSHSPTCKVLLCHTFLCTGHLCIHGLCCWVHFCPTIQE